MEFGQGTGALVPVIRRERPDVVFVEECEYTCQATLRKEFGTEFPYRQAVAAAGSHGSVILSRFPLKGTKGVTGTMGMPGAVADVAGHSVRLQLAHPMPPLPNQVGLWRRELGRLRTFAAADPTTPTVLAGDFNSSQDHAAFRRILDTGLRDAARMAGHPAPPAGRRGSPPPSAPRSTTSCCPRTSPRTAPDSSTSPTPTTAPCSSTSHFTSTNKERGRS